MSLIQYASRIHFADRALEDALPVELRSHRISSLVVAVDDHASEALPRLLDIIPASVSVDVLDLTSAMAETARGQAIVGLGGGRALDHARTARSPEGGSLCIVVPTLPGEIGLNTTASLGKRHRRQPDVVICDPELLAQQSGKDLASAGLDAMIHCLEALLSTAWNPPADGIAFDGLRRAGIWLERLVAAPQDPDARREMMAAALNGALASQKGFGAFHAMSHALELLLGGQASHGSLHGALARAALSFNAPAVPDRLVAAAEALRLNRPEDLAEWLQQLARRIGLAVRLDHLGLTGPGLAQVARSAAEDQANSTNPRLATSSDYARMLEAAL